MASVVCPLGRPCRRGTRSYAVVRDSAYMRRSRGTRIGMIMGKWGFDCSGTGILADYRNNPPVAPSRPRPTPGRATWDPFILEKPLDREADEEPERDGGRGQPGVEKSVHEIASVLLAAGNDAQMAKVTHGPRSARLGQQGQQLDSRLCRYPQYLQVVLPMMRTTQGFRLLGSEHGT